MTTTPDNITGVMWCILFMIFAIIIYNDNNTRQHKGYVVHLVYDLDVIIYNNNNTRQHNRVMWCILFMIFDISSKLTSPPGHFAPVGLEVVK